MAKVKYSWTQPVCPKCWVDIKIKIGRIEPSWKMKKMFCCFCRSDILQGVDTYAIRLNPGTVPYPTVKRDDEDE